MTEPRRLLEGETDEWTRGVLESARADGPSGRSCRKAAVALGLGAATVSAAGSTSATVVGAKVATASVGALVVAKWVGVAAVGIATTVAVVQVARHPTSERVVPPATTGHVAATAAAATTPPPAAAPVPPTAAAAEPEPPAPPAMTVPEPLRAGIAPPSRAALPPTKGLAADSPVSPNAAPLRATPPSAPPVVDSAPAAAPPTEVFAPSATTPYFLPPDNSAAAPSTARRSASTLFAETSALDVARSALRAHDPARALPALDAYDARFPGGALAPEAAVLRIEALSALGSRDDARRLSNAFLQAHPNNPFADRVRKLIPPASIP